MKLTSVLVAVVALVLVISLLCAWFYPSVQDFMAGNRMWNGIKNFTGEFASTNVESLDDLPGLPEKDALVFIPYIKPADKELAQLKRFVTDGGTLLLMDDFGYGNDVLAYLGLTARFSHRPLLDPLFCYKNQRMPRITEFSPEIKENGISKLMLNHGTALTGVEGSQAIAWSSGTSFLDIDNNESWSQDEPRGPFPVAATFHTGRGVITVVSDPSIIINSMVGKDDNYLFVKYLTGSNDEQKSIIMDLSHLTKAPLDVSKTRLRSGREILSKPYTLLGILALVFIVTYRYMLRKGEYFGR